MRQARKNWSTLLASTKIVLVLGTTNKKGGLMKDFTARFVEVVESLGQNGYKLDGVGCITKQKM